MTWQHPIIILSMETQKQDSALQNKIELMWAWPDSSCSLIPHSRYCLEIVSSYFDAKELSNAAQMVVKSTWIATLIIFSKENTLCLGFFFTRLNLKKSNFYCVDNLMHVDSFVVQQHHWKTSGLCKVKDWQLRAVVDCHPFGNWYLKRNRACILANRYETCCPGALGLLNLWLQPNLEKDCRSKGFCLVIFAHCPSMPTFFSLLLFPLWSSFDFILCPWFLVPALDPFA